MKKTIGLGMATIIMVMLVGCGSKSLELLSDNMVVEAGNVLSTDAAEYVKLEDDKMKDDITVDVSGVNTNEVGEGVVKITYKGKEYDVNGNIIFEGEYLNGIIKE